MATKFMAGKRIIGNKSDRDGLTDFNDTLGSSVDGTNSGITLVDMNNYADFSGSSSYISTSGTQSDTDFQIGDSFSISLWFNTTSTSFGSIINRWGSQNGGGNNGWSLLDSGTAISFRFSSSWSSNAIRVNTSSDSAFSDGKWHHLVMTYNGTGHGGVIFYLDGAVKSSSADLTGSVGSITYSLGLALGAYSDGYSDNYDGAMKQALIYSDVLSSSEVTTLYNSGTPVTSPSTSNLVARYDLGTNANDSQGSINGTTNNVSFISDAYKLGTGAYSFDGSNDIVTLGSASDWAFINDKSTDWTLTWWHKNTLGETANSKAIFFTVDNGGTSDGFYLDYRGGQTMRVGFQGSNGSAGGSAIFYCVFNGGGGTTGGTINSDTNAWVHFAIVATASTGTLQLYRNGVLKYTKTISAWGSGYDTDDPFYIGGRKNTQYGKFDIDDFAIYKRKLTQTEITSLVNADETTRQGYAGGDSDDASPYAGAGGGGAGARGGNAVSGAGGDGGIGKASSITGSSLSYAGGGRGGGNSNGTAGTGSIGQGGNATGGSGTNGSAGATGTVILAYTTASGISATGGSIDTSGRSGYKVHTFTSSGTFQITSGSGDVEYLVVAGGGGGGRSNYSNRGAGGGGAGGFLTGTKSSMSSGSYTVTVGSGGAGGTSSTTAGSKGSDSVFDTVTTIGGGGGAGHLSSGDNTSFIDTATDGGSGGGTDSHGGAFGLGTVTRNGALVSSLSNTAGLKAYYSMDSTSLGATAFFTPDDDYASASGWTDVDTGGDIAIDTSNKGVTYTDVNVGDSGIGKSLGKTLSNSKWLVQFTFQIADWNTNDAGLISLTSDHTQGFKVSGLKTINFMPQGTPLGAGSGSYNRFVLMSGQTNSYAEVTSSNNALAVNTQYWVDMYRDGSNVKCKVWTNANRTGTPHFESSNLAIGTNLDGLTGIQHWNENTADIDIGTAWVREVKVYDGVSALDGCKNNAVKVYPKIEDEMLFSENDTGNDYIWDSTTNTWTKII